MASFDVKLNVFSAVAAVSVFAAGAALAEDIIADGPEMRRDLTFGGVGVAFDF